MLAGGIVGAALRALHGSRCIVVDACNHTVTDPPGVPSATRSWCALGPHQTLRGPALREPQGGWCSLNDSTSQTVRGEGNGGPLPVDASCRLLLVPLPGVYAPSWAPVPHASCVHVQGRHGPILLHLVHPQCFRHMCAVQAAAGDGTRRQQVSQVREVGASAAQGRRNLDQQRGSLPPAVRAAHHCREQHSVRCDQRCALACGPCMHGQQQSVPLGC